MSSRNSGPRTRPPCNGTDNRVPATANKTTASVKDRTRECKAVAETEGTKQEREKKPAWDLQERWVYKSVFGEREVEKEKEGREGERERGIK
ncbi:hypothetical protein CLOP_g11935 [Closterium sp. NIES-67]|nr:hypothetical protein CLOP_g11935 [Closterium sp. NIES-67]